MAELMKGRPAYNWLTYSHRRKPGDPQDDIRRPQPVWEGYLLQPRRQPWILVLAKVPMLLNYLASQDNTAKECNATMLMPVQLTIQKQFRQFCKLG